MEHRSERPEVGVSPPQALAERRRLFDALGDAIGITFGSVRDRAAPSAIVHIGPSEAITSDCPTFVAGHPLHRPRATDVVLSTDLHVPVPLRGRRVLDGDVLRAEPLSPRPHEQVLAETSGGPCWTISIDGGISTVRAAVAPDELGPNERLCDRLAAGRFASLLPLVEFLRGTRAGWRFEPAPIRAAFLIDDPNLHASSYGFLGYAAVADAARRHRFHLACATVPLDAWLARKSAAAWFTGADNPLSLLVHGNDHIRRELAYDATAGQAVARLSQALCRIESLERRTDIRVSRVMAPPHGACSRVAMQTLSRVGFEALCISRSYPWLEAPPPTAPLVGWFPADTVEGTTVLPRQHLSSARDAMPLQAYLGRPIILYGHHDDLAEGLDPLLDAAGEINGLGEVRWLPLHAIARSSYDTEQRGTLLRVRLATRRALVTVPPGVDRVVVRPSTDGAVVFETDGAFASGSGPHAVYEGQVLDVRVPHPSAVDHRSVAPPRRSPWPLTRRALVEARDRALPVARQIPGLRGGS